MQASSNEVEPVIITEWRSDLNAHIRVQHLDAPKGFSRSEARTIPTGDEPHRRRSTLDRGMRMSNRSHKHSKQWIASLAERSVLRYTSEDTGGI